MAEMMPYPPAVSYAYQPLKLIIDPSWSYELIWAAQWGGGATVPSEFVALFSTLDDDGIEEAYSASYSDTQPPGRAEAYKTFMGSDNKTVNLTFMFHAQLPSDGANLPANSGTPEWVVEQSRWLELLKHPVYDQDTGHSHAPPPLILKIGRLFIGRVILTECGVTWNSPFEPETLLPHGATCACTFTIVRAPSGTSWSGAVNTLKADVPVHSQFLELRGEGA